MKIHINARAGLGDTVYFFSILQTLFHSLPGLDISIICWNTGQELYGSQLPVRQVINANELVNVMGKGWSHTSPRARKMFADRIGAVDYYIDLQGSQAYLNEAISVDAGKKIAVNPETAVTDHYDICIQTNNGEHILETYRRMLGDVFGITSFAAPGQFAHVDQLSAKADQIVSLLMKQARRPIVCIHPGAKGLDKLWDVLKWGELVKWLVNEHRFQPVLLGSSLRFAGMVPILDIPSAQAIQRLSFDKAFDMAGKTDSILFLIEIIRRAQLYIGLDTGPTHIAAVCGVPTLELFKRQSQEQYDAWRGWGDNVRTIVTDSMTDITAGQAIESLATWDLFEDISRTYTGNRA